jgi:hypothetical protein
MRTLQRRRCSFGELKDKDRDELGSGALGAVAGASHRLADVPDGQGSFGLLLSPVVISDQVDVVARA